MSRNFKNRSLPLTIFLAVLLFNSCQDNFDLIPSDRQFMVLHQKQFYSLSSQKGLNTYIKAVVGNSNIKIKESTIEEVENKPGELYIIRAKYNNSGSVSSIAIPLSPFERTSLEKESELTILTANCTMSCTPSFACTGCDQTIIKICESQICNCNGGTGPTANCSSSIAFGSDEK